MALVIDRLDLHPETHALIADLHWVPPSLPLPSSPPSLLPPCPHPNIELQIYAYIFILIWNTYMGTTSSIGPSGGVEGELDEEEVSADEKKWRGPGERKEERVQ